MQAATDGGLLCIGSLNVLGNMFLLTQGAVQNMLKERRYQPPAMLWRCISGRVMCRKRLHTNRMLVRGLVVYVELSISIV